MANEDTQEVKEFNEVKVMTPSSIGDEEIIEPVVKETDTPAESSEEVKPAPETEEKAPETKEPDPVPEAEIEPEIVKVEPKPVEGETPREKALRLEVGRLKAINREQKRDELFTKQPTNNSKPNEEDFKDYDPEELKRLETLVNKLGYVKKDEILQQTVLDKNNSEFESFLDTHPEYLPENDKDGLLWNQFKSEFSLYNPPQDPKTLKKVLNKVHNEIYGTKPATNLNKINAQKEKLKVASHTAGSQAGKSSAPTAKAPNNNIRYDMLKGFDEEELKDLGA